MAKRHAEVKVRPKNEVGMLIPLLLALSSPLFAAQGAARQSTPPASWPIDWIDTRCPEFRNSQGLVNVASCRVSKSGEFTSLRGDTYYYALYCVEEREFPAEGSCNDPKSFNSSHSDSNIAVFVRSGTSRTVRVVVSQLGGAPGHFRAPRIVESAEGTVMELPFVTAATCDCNVSTYYLWRPQSRDWVPMDWESWQRELSRKLPPRLTNQNGFWPNLATLTAAGSLWRDDDPHCCPSGGSVSVQLGIAGNQFVLKSFDIRVDQPR